MADGQDTPCARVRNRTPWNRSHGRAPAELYTKWLNMRGRCTNPRRSDYANWGGRGIVVCAEWASFEAFRDWAMANGWRPGLWIDRIKNDGPYSPGNCRFITPKESNNNKTNNKLVTWLGRTLTMAQWADELGFDRRVLHHRISRGWSVERILTQPLRQISRRGRGKGHAGGDEGRR